MISFPIILLRLAVALLLGAVVGFEREQKEQTAGMRTLALVSLGSALFTIVSAYGFLAFLDIPRLVLDPSRTASYIVAGIGFLGAGTIFMSRQNEKVKGLTTAATIWVIAAVGLACGVGLLWEAVTATAMVLFVLFVVPFLENAILPRPSTSPQHLYIDMTSLSGQNIAAVYDICVRNKITIEKLHLQTQKEGEPLELICRIPNEGALAKAISELSTLPEVISIRADQLGAGFGKSTSDGSTN